MSAPSISAQQVADWRRLFTKGPLPQATNERKAVLSDIGHRPVRNVRALLDLHDLVLFALAHPVSIAEHRLALRALDQVAVEAERLGASGDRNAVALSNTGLAHTSVTVAFSRELVAWLWKRHPQHVSLHSLDGDLKAAKPWIKGLLPRAEQEAFELDEFDLDDWLANARGKGRPADLEWWLHLTEGLPAAVRSTLYEQLHLYVSVDLAHTGLSATFGRSAKRPLHTFPQGLPRSVILHASFNNPSPRRER